MVDALQHPEARPAEARDVDRGDPGGERPTEPALAQRVGFRTSTRTTNAIVTRV